MFHIVSAGFGLQFSSQIVMKSIISIEMTSAKLNYCRKLFDFIYFFKMVSFSKACEFISPTSTVNKQERESLNLFK